MKLLHAKRGDSSFLGSRPRAISLPGLVALVAAGTLGGAACGSSNKTSPPQPDGGGGDDSSTIVTPGEDAAGGSDAATGGGSDAGAEASAASLLDLGFFPSNISCALTETALDAIATDAGIDLTMLADVDISAASDLGRLPQGPVAQTLYRQTNGTQVAVYIANSWTIEATGTLTLTGNYPIALVAVKDITIYANGLIDGTTNNPGGYTAPAAQPGPGGGPGGGPSASDNGTIYDAGGGSYCGTGGTGTGSTLVTPAYGMSTIIPLVGGSSGGNSGYGGGTGGGAIELVAGTSITVGGTITVGGAAGFRNSGGGSGGAILIEAPLVTVTGTLAANGGGGSNVFGGAPQGGLPSATPAQGSAAGNDEGAGGNGSGGATITGGPGGPPADSMGAGAGGGGGAGYIRINTMTGSTTLTGATLSPSAATTCATQGKISSTAPTCK